MHNIAPKKVGAWGVKKGWAGKSGLLCRRYLQYRTSLKFHFVSGPLPLKLWRKNAHSTHCLKLFCHAGLQHSLSNLAKAHLEKEGCKGKLCSTIMCQQPSALVLVQDVNAANLTKVRKEARNAALKHYQDQQIDFGPNFQTAVTCLYAKECSLQELLTVVSPCQGDPQPWLPLAPTIASCNFSLVDKARITLRVLVHERLVRAISKGSAGLEELKALLEILQKLSSFQSAGRDDPEHFLAAACQELGRISNALSALLELIPATAENLDPVMTATQGASALVKGALRQCPMWKQKEKDLRKVQTAMQTMGPQVEAACKALEDGKAELETMMGKYPMWMDALPPGSTLALETKLQHHFSAELKALSAGGTSEALNTFIRLSEKCTAAMPSSMRTREFFEKCALDAREALKKQEAAAELKHVQDLLRSFVGKD